MLQGTPKPHLHQGYNAGEEGAMQHFHSPYHAQISVRLQCRILRAEPGDVVVKHTSSCIADGEQPEAST
jgi:hypothetical protein